MILKKLFLSFSLLLPINVQCMENKRNAEPIDQPNPIAEKLDHPHALKYISNPIWGGLIFGTGLGLAGGLFGFCVEALTFPLTGCNTAHVGKTTSNCAVAAAELGAVLGAWDAVVKTQKHRKLFKRIGAKSLQSIIEKDDEESFKEWMEMRLRDGQHRQKILDCVARSNARKICKLFANDPDMPKIIFPICEKKAQRFKTEGGTTFYSKYDQRRDGDGDAWKSVPLTWNNENTIPT